MRGLFRLPALRRLEEKHLLLHDGVVLEHAERSVRARPDHRAVVARQGHGDQPDGHRAGFRWVRVSAADLRVRGRVLGFGRGAGIEHRTSVCSSA